MSTPTVITRAQWGARPPTSPVDTTAWASRTGFVVHYSAEVPTQTVRQIQNYQMDVKGFRDIGYNWLVTIDGRVWEGRQHTWTAVGAHVENHNTANIGACMIGRDVDVTDEAKVALRWLYDEACRLAGRTLAMRYHSLLAATSCPGDQLRSWVIAGMPTPTGDDDMTPEQARQLLVAELRTYHLLANSPTIPNVPYSDATVHDEPNKIAAAFDDIEVRLAALEARPPVEPAPVDPAALRAVLLDPEVLAAYATAVADEHAARLES